MEPIQYWSFIKSNNSEKQQLMVNKNISKIKYFSSWVDFDKTLYNFKDITAFLIELKKIIFILFCTKFMEVTITIRNYA